MTREPINILVLLQHQRLLPLNRKEPRRNRPIHDALLAARIEWIFVANILNLPHRALFLQIFGDEFIILPDFQVFVDAIGVVAIIINNMEGVNTKTLCQLKVVLTISWRDVHDTRTRLVRDEIRRVNGVNLVIFWPGRASIKWLVFLTHQFAPREGAQYFVIKRLMLFILQGALQGFLGNDQLFAVNQHLTIRHLWINRQQEVCWQCPRCGGPGKDRVIAIE